VSHFLRLVYAHPVEEFMNRREKYFKEGTQQKKLKAY